MPIIKCDYCGIEFDKKQSNINQSEREGLIHYFCSKECFGKSNYLGSKTLICAFCGKSFKKSQKLINRSLKIGLSNHFCSRECSSEFRKRTSVIICDYCGKDFEKDQHDINRANKKGYKHLYCSRECMGNANKLIRGKENPHYKTGVKLYRREALAMYENNCLICSCNEKLHVHHIDGNRHNNPSDGSNWIVLCQLCHNRLHIKSRHENISLQKSLKLLQAC